MVDGRGLNGRGLGTRYLFAVVVAQFKSTLPYPQTSQPEAVAAILADFPTWNLCKLTIICKHSQSATFVALA